MAYVSNNTIISRLLQACMAFGVAHSHALITRSVGAKGDYPTITAALAALSPFSDNVVLQVNTGFNGYEEPGADYNSTTNFNGHTLDLLAAQATTSQITYYVGSDVEYRTDPDGNLETVESVHGGAFSARRVYEGKGSPSGTEYLVKNHLGSTVAMTDEQGHSLGTYYEYAAYGTQDKLQSGPTARVTQTFTGKELDEDVDLYYFGARYYDPELSLWLSPDVVKQYSSPYSYSPNPANSIDPDGNCSAPTGLKQGQIGFCYEAFIASYWIGFGGRGDYRSFSATDQNLSARIRLKLIYDPSTKSVVKNSIQHEEHRSGVLFKNLGPHGTIKLGISQNENGFSFGAQGINGFGHLLFKPINGNFSLSPDGKGGLSLDEYHLDSYPSVGLYSYKMDSKGQISSSTIKEFQETKSANLGGDPELNYKK